MTTDLTPHLKYTDKVRCGSCEWAGEALDLTAEIKEIAARITPGETVPAGECPKCGALAYLILITTTPRGRAYRRLRRLIERHVTPDDAPLGNRLMGFAKEHTLRAMAIMAAYHDSGEDGLPQTRFDAVHALLFAAVLCACEGNVKGTDGVMAFSLLKDEQKAALQELLNVADDMICTTLDGVAVDVPEGLEEAALDHNMTKQ